jgi:signal transduction histidine kinase/CheY-like chemotaxis protein
MFSPTTIRSKLLLAILPLVAAGVGAIVGMQYVRTRGQILTDIHKEIHAAAERGARNIDDLLQQRRGDLFVLSETPLIADYSHNVDYDLRDEAEAYRRELEQYLLHFAQRSQVYARILYLDKSGREVCRIERDRISPARRADPAAPYFAEARKLWPGGWWVSPIGELPDGGSAVFYAKPVHDEVGRLAGVLVLCYDLSGIGSILKETKVGRTGWAYLRTPDGAFPRDAGPRSRPRDLLSTQSPLKEMPWALAVEAPLEEFLDPLRSIRDAAVLTALLGIVGLLAVLLWLVNSITRPVASLVDAARRIGGGDLGHRIARVGDDELGALSSAFNEMAGSLESNRKRNDDLQAQLIQAEKLSAVGQLISSVAHELNNPLAAVYAGSQLLAWEGCPEAQRYELERLAYNALRCRKVVDNLLFFVRKGRREKERIDLNKVVESALELLEYRLVKTEHVVVVKELDGQMQEAVGDFQEIVQVLVNLINNSCDAMDQVSRPGGKRITLSTKVDGGFVRLGVSDNGAGISAAVQENIFEPFFTTKEPGRGTGLGLPICRQILEAHDGSISCQAREGEGASFLISLPIATEAELGALERPAVMKDLPAIPGRRILVVDDEPDLVAVIARVVRGDGDHVDTATEGAEALSLLDANRYDLVISDFEMEGVKGDEIHARLRAQAPSAAPNILFVTGDIFNPKVLRFMDETKSSYLVKPFETAELRQTVRRLLAAGMRPAPAS